ncbi:MAG TPA: hypothetical protein VFI88_00400 [Sphingomicrobium sp.]|nr:hypothetical protein [Sphingomicrobium sp.]
MRPTLRTIAFTVGFWFCVLFVGGFVAVIHGDCFADQQCIKEKQWISIATLAIGAVAYIVLLVIVRPWKIEGDSN